MSSFDAATGWPNPHTRYYERGAVQTFLTRADAARAWLERALEVADQRRKAAESELAEVADRAAGLLLEAGTVGASLQAERDATWGVIAARLAEAELEAAEIIATAEAEALAIRAARPVRQPEPVLIPAERWGRRTVADDRSARIDLVAG